MVHEAMKRLGSGSAWLQKHWEFLEQLLFLGWKESDGGGCLGTSWFNEGKCTCLGKGAAGSCMQNLLFKRNNRKAKGC